MKPPWLARPCFVAELLDRTCSQPVRFCRHYYSDHCLTARCFLCRALKTVSPPVSPSCAEAVIAGVDGDVVRGVTASPPVCWEDLSAAILLAAFRRPSTAGVAFIS